jgi:hypothetical protein
MTAGAHDPSEALMWREVSQRLDDAVLTLSALDQRAIVLRYFQGKPVAEVALALNVSEAAAQRRIGRAIEKLRGRLSRIGGLLPALDAAALAALLGSHATTSAPPQLANQAAAAALNQNTATGAGLLIAKGAMTMMTWQKVKIVTATAAMIVLGAGGFIALNNALAQEKTPEKAPAAAGTPTRTPAGARPRAGTPVQVATAAAPITSVADAPPAIISTTPQAGATGVDPSLTEIRVTFSKPVESAKFETLGTVDRARFPTTTAAASAASDDPRIWVLPVKLEAGKTYVLPVFNATDADKRRSFPYILVFETKP